jgi:hypothetical protein
MADRIARVWTGTIWEPISAPVSIPNSIAYWQATAPTGVPTGTLWVDSDDNSQWMYNGASWISLSVPGAVTETGTQTLTNKTLTSPIINSPVTTVGTNAQTGTAYTLVIGDRDKIVELSNAAAITLTVPTNASAAFPVGSSVMLLQTGAGQVTIGGAGVTINATPGLKLRAQWSSATLFKRATDTWVAVGDLAA